MPNAHVAARAALGSAITQGIGVATGMQSKFSWAAVAGAGIGAWAGAQVRDMLPASTPSIVSRAVGHSAEALASAAATWRR
jgi:uncharacterized membrane protein YeiH